MNIIKKIVKQNIFGFIVGGIFFGSISAYATTVLSSDLVSYSNTTGGLSSTNVQGAIDELYGKTIYGNASSNDILSGKTAMVNGVKITGTMPNQGAKTVSINLGESYTIPAGYHNGSGKITAAGTGFSSTLVLQGYHYGIQSRTWIPNLKGIYKYVTITFSGKLYGENSPSSTASRNGTALSVSSGTKITLADYSYSYFGWGGNAGGWTVTYSN